MSSILTARNSIGVTYFDRDQCQLMGKCLLASLMGFVACVSFYDGYLVLRTGEMIQEFEQNPLGRFLIDFNHGDPTLFLLSKAIGTVLAIAALIGLARYSPRYAKPVAFALALFQGGLLMYLENPY